MTPTNRLKRPIRLVLDYDGTLTVKDTMAIYGTLPKNNHSTTKLTWDEIVNAYMKDYESYQKQHYPWHNYDRTEYSSWLASRKQIEHQSAKRVQDAGFFQGVRRKDVEDAVDRAFETGELKLRAGWTDLLEACYHQSGSTVEILSVNWSETAIRRSLQVGASRRLESNVLNAMPIHANEIEGLDSLEGSSGQVIRSDGTDIRTSDDKLRRMKACGNNGGQFTVYIGDSSTDFDCLCEADLGIWLFDVPEEAYEEASKKVFSPLEYVPPRLSTLKDVAGEKAMFYWAPDFKTVLEVLSTSGS